MEEERANINEDGVTEEVQDVRDEFIAVMNDIYHSHVTNRKKRESWPQSRRDWMVRRADDLFSACEFTETTLQEWIERQDHLN